MGAHAENDFTGQVTFMYASSVAMPPPETPMTCTSFASAPVAFTAYSMASCRFFTTRSLPIASGRVLAP